MKSERAAISEDPKRVRDAPTDQPVVALTGVGGYVGSRIAAYFQSTGWDVWGLSRSTNSVGPWAKTIPFSLDGDLNSGQIRGADALVHCAYDFNAAKWDEIRRINVDGSARLLKAAREAGVPRVVVISTMSAFDGCVSMYGRAKLEIEGRAQEAGAVVVRPGLVYGQGAAGMVGALDGVVRRAPVVPLFGKGDQVLYLVHQEDLAGLVMKLCNDRDVQAEPIVAASERGLTFREILARLAKMHGRHPLFVPFPWQAAWLGLKSAETLGLRLRLRSDSLVSLLNQNPRPDFGPARRVGVRFRDFVAWDGR